MAKEELVLRPYPGWKDLRDDQRTWLTEFLLAGDEGRTEEDHRLRDECVAGNLVEKGETHWYITDEGMACFAESYTEANSMNVTALEPDPTVATGTLKLDHAHNAAGVLVPVERVEDLVIFRAEKGSFTDHELGLIRNLAMAAAKLIQGKGFKPDSVALKTQLGIDRPTAIDPDVPGIHVTIDVEFKYDEASKE